MVFQLVQRAQEYSHCPWPPPPPLNTSSLIPDNFRLVGYRFVIGLFYLLIDREDLAATQRSIEEHAIHPDGGILHDKHLGSERQLPKYYHLPGRDCGGRDDPLVEIQSRGDSREVRVALKVRVAPAPAFLVELQGWVTQIQPQSPVRHLLLER